MIISTMSSDWNWDFRFDSLKLLHSFNIILHNLKVLHDARELEHHRKARTQTSKVLKHHEKSRARVSKTSNYVSKFFIRASKTSNHVSQFFTQTSKTSISQSYSNVFFTTFELIDFFFMSENTTRTFKNQRFELSQKKVSIRKSIQDMKKFVKKKQKTLNEFFFIRCANETLSFVKTTIFEQVKKKSKFETFHICTICERSFVRLHNLQRHQKKKCRKKNCKNLDVA